MHEVTTGKKHNRDVLVAFIRDHGGIAEGARKYVWDYLYPDEDHQNNEGAATVGNVPGMGAVFHPGDSQGNSQGSGDVGFPTLTYDQWKKRSKKLRKKKEDTEKFHKE